ncbi:hypothetical protein B0H66DRAFT_626309 [Apodospora peruviana]|uniref:Uncharacterized protein n=1 Tax=Apodospora peruviana TaxID=516989 RepID=A0AAE0I1L7_9PEZI|nr:hypothetical protein B0H66DRAFT_626309 [Apodospora peruviana]
MKTHRGAFAAFALMLATSLVEADPYPAQPLPTFAPRHVGVMPPRVTPTAVHRKRQKTVFEPGEIGVKPLPTESLKASLREGHTKYLTEESGTTSWIGPDPTWIGVKTTTISGKVVTATKGVSAIKNAEGGMDILLSPGVKAKLDSIAKEVTPCAGKRFKFRRRGDACGLADFLERVRADEQLGDTFSEQLTDQVWGEVVDEGFVEGDDVTPGYEGDGVPEEIYHGAPADHPDEGFSEPEVFEDEAGWFEPAGGAGEEGAAAQVETIVFGTAEEAAAITEALAVGEVVPAGASTMTAGSFLGLIYNKITGGGGGEKAEDLIVTVPKENIHKISKPKDKGGDEEHESSSTSSSACSSQTELPECGNGCTPTSSADPKATGAVTWACSEGDTKGCPCNPVVDEIVDTFNWNDIQAMWKDIDTAKERPDKPRFDCGQDRTAVASKYFGEVSKAFCKNHFKKDEASGTALVFDIHGNEIPNKGKRSPPERGPEAYEHYRFNLHWTPDELGGSCKGVDVQNLCQDAFDQLQNSACGINHGSPVDRLFKDATADINCGEIGWHITEEGKDIPPPPPGPKRDIYIMRDGGFFNVFETSDGNLDPCDHDPVSVQGFNSWNKNWPPNLNEQWTSFGHEGMHYQTFDREPTDEEGSAGELIIPGKENVKCKKDPQNKSHKCFMVKYTRVVRCEWND